MQLVCCSLTYLVEKGEKVGLRDRFETKSANVMKYLSLQRNKGNFNILAWLSLEICHLEQQHLNRL